jgi:hypothetical protein
LIKRRACGLQAPTRYAFAMHKDALMAGGNALAEVGQSLLPPNLFL